MKDGRPAVWHVVAFAAAYVALAGLGQGFALIPGVEVTFWPPAGVFMAALLVSARRWWPIWISTAFAAEMVCSELWFENPWYRAPVYFAGNALTAVVGAWLIGKFVGRRPRLETLPEVALVVGLGVGIAPMMSATVIAATDAFVGRSGFWRTWPLAWLGDSTGLLVVLPLTLAAVRVWTDRERIARPRLLEAGAVAGLIVLTVWLATRGETPVMYAALPPLLWAAARFRLPGAAAAVGVLTLATAGFAARGEATGLSPAELRERIIGVQTFLGVSAVSALIVAALASRLREEQRRALSDEQRRRAEEVSRERARLAVALRAAGLGAYEWTVGDAEVWWSPELYALYGTDPEVFVPTVEAFTSLVHPEDREELWRKTRESMERGTPFEHDYRIIRPDGRERWVHNHSVVVRNAAGEPERITGIAVDITERREAERRLQASDERLRLAQRAADIGLHDWDIRAGTIEWDERTRRLWGMGPDEAVTYEVFRSRLHPDDVGVTQAAVDKALDPAGDGRYRAEYRVINPRDGVERWVLALGQTTFEQGRPVRMVGTVHDITERVSSDRALRTQMERSELLSRSLEELLSARGPGEILATLIPRVAAHVGADAFFNFMVEEEAGALRLQGCAGVPEAVMRGIGRLEFGQAICGRVAVHRRPVLAEDIQNSTDEASALVRSMGIQVYFCNPLIVGDRLLGTLSFASRTRTSFGPDEREFLTTVSQHVAIAMDRLRTESELRAHRERLEELVARRTAQLEETHRQLRVSERMAALGTLAAGLGHDMGNLLGPVRMRLELLEAMRLPEAGREEVAAICEAVEYLKRLSGGLRLLSVDSGGEDRGETTELDGWWREASAVLKSALPRGVVLEGGIERGGLAVRMSRPALTQVVFNLVQNAGEAMRERARGTVRVRAERAGEDVALIVSDDGPGMTEEVRTRCMEPFFTTKTRDVSTGLGLALVYGLVQKAGGAIELESALGKGTTFRVVLRAAGREEAPAPRDGRGRLAVLDVRDARIRAIVEQDLKRWAFEVRVGRDGTGDGAADLAITDDDAAWGGFPGPLIVLAERNGASDHAVVLGRKPRIEAIRTAIRQVAESV